MPAAFEQACFSPRLWTCLLKAASMPPNAAPLDMLAQGSKHATQPPRLLDMLAQGNKHATQPPRLWTCLLKAASMPPDFLEFAL
jgi:hypothetical protein